MPRWFRGASEPVSRALPDWAPGTVTVLSTGAGAPHAIPVSTGVRTGPRTVLVALALRRETLARLREDPRCALTVLGEGDVAFTAHATATLVQEPMEVNDQVVAVRLDVDEVQDHGDPRGAVEAGVRWRWTDAEAQRRDAEIRQALRALG
jgi:Pyridoxamine 5'-phosphate oxidase